MEELKAIVVLAIAATLFYVSTRSNSKNKPSQHHE